MKKLLSVLPFILACCLLIVAIGWGAFGIYDINLEVERLEALPSASGVNYLGFHGRIVIYGTGLFLISACGLVLAWISRKVVKSEKLRMTSKVLIILFGFLLFLPVAVCILGML